MTTEAKELYEMGLHDRIEVAHSDLFVTRVPGGWIYAVYRLDCNAMTSVFVPFDNEFQPVPPPTDKF